MQIIRAKILTPRVVIKIVGQDGSARGENSAAATEGERGGDGGEGGGRAARAAGGGGMLPGGSPLRAHWLLRPSQRRTFLAAGRGLSDGLWPYDARLRTIGRFSDLLCPRIASARLGTTTESKQGVGESEMNPHRAVGSAG